MSSVPLLRNASDLSWAWLARVLGDEVVGVATSAGTGNWSNQAVLEVSLRGGGKRRLRLKTCLGDTFGRSEVDYYTRDYRGLPDAPLVRCFDAHHEPGVGYHILMEDLSATHCDRRDAAPTLAYGRAVACALARLHRHHWQSAPCPDPATLDRYLDAIRPGIGPLEAATGRPFRERFEAHASAFRARWSNPVGMTLLHGDLNPTNVLTPQAHESPVLFLDRQPFAWSLTYGLAVWDLAYFLVPWWPVEDRQAVEMDLLHTWHQALDRADYPFGKALEDWHLSVGQCLHVPVQWCTSEHGVQQMR